MEPVGRNQRPPAVAVQVRMFSACLGYRLFVLRPLLLTPVYASCFCRPVRLRLPCCNRQMTASIFCARRYQHLGSMMALGQRNAAVALPLSLPRELTAAVDSTPLGALLAAAGVRLGGPEVTLEGPLAAALRRAAYLYRQPTGEQRTQVRGRFGTCDAIWLERCLILFCCHVQCTSTASAPASPLAECAALFIDGYALTENRARGAWASTSIQRKGRTHFHCRPERYCDCG